MILPFNNENKKAETKDLILFPNNQKIQFKKNQKKMIN